MTSLRLPLLVIALLLQPAAACAGTAKAAAGTFGTREQLRDCLAQDDALRQRTHDLEAAVAAVNQKFDANEAEAVKLVDTKKTLDRSDKSAIATFNQLAQDHNLHLQQAHQQEADNELAGNILATDKAAVEQKCGGLTYRPADMEVVTRERKKAAAVAAAGAASAP